MMKFGGEDCMTAEDFIHPTANKVERSVEAPTNDSKSYAMTALKFVAINEKGMSNGMRMLSRLPLTEEEIKKLKEDIKRIGADESVFVFNDEAHRGKTCYNYADDKIYVGRNVLPETKYGSTHPRDTMSSAAVLAHEYYGHRPHRDEYLSDLETGKKTMAYWEDECRASITAAKTTPNLTDIERRDLIEDAVYRAQETGHMLEMDNEMKTLVYGYDFSDNEKHIAMPTIQTKQQGQQQDNSNSSQVRKTTKNNSYTER